jgi:hypothetical protein
VNCNSFREEKAGNSHITAIVPGKEQGAGRVHAVLTAAALPLSWHELDDYSFVVRRIFLRSLSVLSQILLLPSLESPKRKLE